MVNQNFFSTFRNQSEKMTALQSLVLGQDLSIGETKTIKEFKLVKDFLELPLNDKKERVLKKAFAASVIVAGKGGNLPFNLPKDPRAIAATIDEGLDRLKTSYKVGQGTLDPVEAVDYLIDKAAAKTVSFVERVIEKGVPVVLEKVADAVGRVYPPAKALKPVVMMAEQIIIPVAKKIVRKGVDIVANSAKKVVRKAFSGAKKVMKKFANFLKI